MRNILVHSSLKSLVVVLFFLFFTVTFANFFLHSINYIIKKKYILLEIKVPWPMSAISETYNRTHNSLDILPNAAFTTNETERDC